MPHQQESLAQQLRASWPPCSPHQPPSGPFLWGCEPRLCAGSSPRGCGCCRAAILLRHIPGGLPPPEGAAGNGARPGSAATPGRPHAPHSSEGIPRGGAGEQRGEAEPRAGPGAPRGSEGTLRGLGGLHPGSNSAGRRAGTHPGRPWCRRRSRPAAAARSPQLLATFPPRPCAPPTLPQRARPPPPPAGRSGRGPGPPQSRQPPQSPSAASVPPQPPSVPPSPLSPYQSPQSPQPPQSPYPSQPLSVPWVPLSHP